MVAVFRGVAEAGERDKPTARFTTRDIAALKEAILQEQARLVVFNPLQSYLPEGKTMNRAEDMRPILDALGELAQETRCTILIVRHFGKRMESRHSLHKAIGSIDIPAAARSVLFVGRDPDWINPNPAEYHERFVVAHAKSNLAPKGPSLAFELKEDFFRWLDEGSPLTASDLAGNQPTNPFEPDRSTIQNAVDFLKEALLSGPRERSAVVREGKEMGGFSESTLDRAANRLGVKKEWTREGGKIKYALWRLPDGSG